MNNIIFSNLTKKQIIDLYKNNEYNKAIQLLTMIFTNRNGYREYLSKNKEEVVFSDILYIWTVRDEFKGLLKSDTYELTIDFFNAINKDFIEYLFTEKEIVELRIKLDNYFYKRKNSMLVKNYIHGNFSYVVDSVKYDYDDIIDFESRIVNNKDKKREIPALREIFHITNKIDFNKTYNPVDSYYYGMLKNLIFFYNNLSFEYTLRYLTRQVRLGVNFDELLSGNILNMFDEEERKIITDLYQKHIKDDTKDYSGLELYNISEYATALHMFTTILELEGSIEDIYYQMYFVFNYKAGKLKSNLKRMDKVLSSQALNRLKEISDGYSDYIASVQKKEKNKKRDKQIKEISKIIEVLIEDDVNIDVYFNKTSTLKEEFRKIISFMKKNTPELYSKYLKVKNYKIKEAGIKVAEAIRKNHCINEIDYYMITNIPYEDIRKFLTEYDFDVYVIFSEFVKIASNENVLNEKSLERYLNADTKFLYWNNDMEKIIVEPTKEDKIRAVNFLNSIGAPITYANIDNAIKRFLNSNLDKEKVKFKK